MTINPEEFISFPKEVVIGFIPADVQLEPIKDALNAAGLVDDQIDFLRGEKGLEILNTGGSSATMRQRLTRKIERISEEGEHLLQAVEHLETGQTLVGIRRVTVDEAPRVRQTLEEAGVVDHHYFGKYTFD
jgi:hypothetical protein